MSGDVGRNVSGEKTRKEGVMEDVSEEEKEITCETCEQKPTCKIEEEIFQTCSTSRITLSSCGNQKRQRETIHTLLGHFK